MLRLLMTELRLTGCTCWLVPLHRKSETISVAALEG